jgi:hypothetical protein
MAIPLSNENMPTASLRGRGAMSPSGTFRTSRNVRSTVAIGGKADLPSHSRKLTSWGKIGVPQVLTEEALMKRIALAFLITAFAVGSASAQTCATKAMSKDGKPLAGAAKTSFVKKCCEDSAVSKDGKPLSGAAKNSHVTKCMKDG